MFYIALLCRDSVLHVYWKQFSRKYFQLVAGQQAARMPSPMVSQQTMSAGSVLGSAIESALSQTQQLQQIQQMQQYGMIPSQTATTVAAAAYSPAQMMGGAQLLQQPTQSTAALSTTPTASGLTPESILQAYSGVQGICAQGKTS